MSALKKSSAPTVVAPIKSDKRLIQKFNERRSAELVIALAGPIGCGIGSVANALEERLKELGYIDVIRVKLSDVLESAIKEHLISVPPDESNE